VVDQNPRGYAHLLDAMARPARDDAAISTVNDSNTDKITV
jgi:hypothetical protein